MAGMLQGFYKDQILCDLDGDSVARAGIWQAVQLAMLGLVDEANGILGVIAAHVKFEPKLELRYLWAEGKLKPPSPLEAYDYGSTLEDAERGGLDQLPYLLDDLNWDDIDDGSLTRMHDVITKGASGHSLNSTTGYNAMRASSQYAALLVMAYRLGRDDIVSAVMPEIAKRIHANQQVLYLTRVRALWQPYLLSGQLRECIGVPLVEVQEYARFVGDVIKQRLERGPLRLEGLYKDFSTLQLLEEIDRDTISGPEYAEYYGIEKEPSSILYGAATEEEIEAAEQRFGQQLPLDFKEYLRISNGCNAIRVGGMYTSFKKRLPPLGEMKFEEEDYMSEYAFALLSSHSASYEVEWEGVGSGIAMWEHQGQSTQHVWILDRQKIDEAKSILEDVYDTADETVKEAIDADIVRLYGSREAYDEMNEYCLYEQPWGALTDETRVFPSFRAFLIQIAYESKHIVDRSPLKMPEEE